jgi:hypothetical protein
MFYSTVFEDHYVSNFFDSSYKGTCFEIKDSDKTESNIHHFKQNGWVYLTELVEPKIDLISISAENPGMDIVSVLKGIDFIKYDVRFLIVNKVSTDHSIQSYLHLQRFKKIHSIESKDIYVNRCYLDVKIHNVFEIFRATYYTIDKIYIGNATDLVKLLTYKYNGTNNVIVSNDIFTDTCPGHFKRLFIEIKNVVTGKIHKYCFGENSFLDFETIYNSLKKESPVEISKSPTLSVSVSIGEIIDKYSILELKLANIADPNKLRDIRREMDVLNPHIESIKNNHLYRMLLYVNGLIWNDTNSVKKLLENYDETNMELVSTNAKISNRIFENNQKRFRIKKLLNDVYSSAIKEHKSYVEKCCFVQLDIVDTIYRKIAEINYLCMSYDCVYFAVEFKDVIQSIFSDYNISFLESIDTDLGESYDLSIYSIEEDIRPVFELEPISYISGGRLGDFLNQLSVICENYYKTGRKGILYISDKDNHKFTFSVEETYADTFEMISLQRYIKDYKIYKDEKIDINLSEWIDTHNWVNWYETYHSVYKVDWGKHKWLEYCEMDSNWRNKIIINITPYRFICDSAAERLKSMIGSDLDNCVFISNEKEHYDHFCSKTGLDISYYRPKDFNETVSIISSCRMCYLGFSGIAVIANALHKPHYLMGETNTHGYIINSIVGIMPHALGML